MSDSSKDARVVLREERSKNDFRHLSAGYADNGDLLIEGQDLGDGVEQIFGCREYEWVWTIRAADLAKLAEALGATSDLLGAMAMKFGGDKAAHLGAFLKENEVPYEAWSRLGD